MGLESIAEVETISSTSKLDVAADAGSNKIRLRTIPHTSYVSNRPFILIDAYSSYCEVMQVTSQHNRELTLSSNLVYAHAAGTRIAWIDGRELRPEMFGPCGPNDDASIPINAALATGAIISGFGQTRPGRLHIKLQPGKLYLLSNPILIWDMQGIVLDGGAPNMGAVVHGKCSGQAMIEIIGSQDVVMQNLQLWGDQTLTPACGTWTSRSNTVHGTNSNNITFRNVEYMGYYTKCAHYCVESESNHFYECWSYLLGNTGLDSIVHVSSTNDLSITPAGGTLAGTGYGNVYLKLTHCGLSSAPGYQAIKIMDICQVDLDTTYIYSAATNAVELVQNATLFANVIMMEGTPDNAIKLTRTSGTPAPVLCLNNSHLGTPNNYTILGDANAILTNSRFTGKVTPGLSGGAYKPVKLYRAEGCDFSGFMSNSSYVFDINIDAGYSLACKFWLGTNDTITYTNGATSNGDTVINDAAVGDEYLQVTALKIGSGSKFTALRTGSKTWDVGSLADGATASTYLDTGFSDVLLDGAWIAIASLTSLDEDGWVISAYPAIGSVRVTVTNHSGGVIDPPSGTLRVVAMKVA